MDSKKINAFLAVKRSGSLTAAAAELNYTQSGMTHMMDALEKELGITLLVRGRNGVALTPAAERLLPKIEAFATAAAALDGELQEMLAADLPCLRIGAYSSMAQHWLPAIIQQFRQKCPGTELTVQMGTIQEIYHRVKSGELDCAFVSWQPEEISDALEWVPLHDDALLAVLPPDDSFSDTLFKVSDFEGKEFLMPTNGFDLDILPVFHRSGIHPNIHITNLDDPAIISMVEHSLGLSVLTELVMTGRKDNVRTAPLDPPAYRKLGLIFHKDPAAHHLMNNFLQQAQETVQGFYRAG